MVNNISSSLILSQSDIAQQLIDKLSSCAEIVHIPPRRRLSLQVSAVRLCYVILEGQVSVHRISDGLMLGTLHDPGLIGIVNMDSLVADAYLRTLVPCKIGILKVETAREVICTHNLWEHVTKHMFEVASKLVRSGEKLSLPSSYDMICVQLQELINQPPEIRNNITAEHYVREKTYLSRSGIMRVLAELKKGGYIETHRGILIKINNLPSKF